MSKTQKTWKGHPVYESPDGLVNTIDKDRYDTHMRMLDAAKARERRRAKLAKTGQAQQKQETPPDNQQQETPPPSDGEKSKK